MTYTVHHAKTHLSKLMAEAEAGREVVIARRGKPAVRLVPVDPPAPRKGIKAGWLKGLVEWNPAMEEPLSEDELRLWEGEAS